MAGIAEFRHQSRQARRSWRLARLAHGSRCCVPRAMGVGRNSKLGRTRRHLHGHLGWRLDVPPWSVVKRSTVLYFRAKFDGAERRSSQSVYWLTTNRPYKAVYYTSEPLRAEGGALSGPWVFHRQGRAKHAPPEPRDEASPRRSNQAALHGAD